MLNSTLFAFGCSALFTLAVGMPAMASSPGKEEHKTDASAEAFPELSLDGVPEVWLQGEPVKKWEKDKLYIFEFWATWCGPCLAAMPHMEHLYQVFKGNPDMQIIGVNVMDRKSPEALKEFLKNRPSPLNYAMAVDVDGKRTKEKWLDPMEVNGIPHAFAIKNGKLIWRGHPAKLTEEMLTAMLKPDFSPALLPKSTADSVNREHKLYLQTVDMITQLVQKKGLKSVMPLLKQIQASGKFPQDQLIQLKMVPFSALVQQGKFEEAQTVLADLAEEYSDNYRVQINIAGNLMDTEVVPVGKVDAALVERCLNRCIEISRNDNKEASLPWRIMAELRERQGNGKEALADMEKAISLSSVGKAWTKLKELSGDQETLSSLLDQAIAEIKPEPPRKTQDMGAIQEDSVYTPLLKKQVWFNHPGVAGLPAGKTMFISFWRAFARDGKLRGDGAPSRTLDIVLKKNGLLDHPNVKAVVLSVRPLNKQAVEEYLARPETWTAYPVGVPSDDSVMELFQSLKLDTFPTVAVVRDRVLVWSGETKRMPAWVAEVARRDTFDKNQFAEETAKRLAYEQKMKDVIKKSFELRKQKKYEEYIKLMEDHAAQFADNGWFASTVAEIQAGKAVRGKDLQKAVEILDQVMQRFPKEDSIASYYFKIFGSDEIRDYSYDAARHALQIMRDANTRGDSGYNAACYEVMMKMAMDKKDYAQAKKDALNALRELPMVHQYAAMKKKQGNA